MTKGEKNPTPLIVRIIMYPYVYWYEWREKLRERKEYYENNINPNNHDGLGHKHEWGDHEKDGCVYCWVCKEERELVNNSFKIGDKTQKE